MRAGGGTSERGYSFSQEQSCRRHWCFWGRRFSWSLGESLREILRLRAEGTESLGDSSCLRGRSPLLFSEIYARKRVFRERFLAGGQLERGIRGEKGESLRVIFQLRREATGGENREQQTVRGSGAIGCRLEDTLRYECNIVYGLIWIPITPLCFLLISECWLACLGG